MGRALPPAPATTTYPLPVLLSALLPEPPGNTSTTVPRDSPLRVCTGVPALMSPEPPAAAMWVECRWCGLEAPCASADCPLTWPDPVAVSPPAGDSCCERSRMVSRWCGLEAAAGPASCWVEGWALPEVVWAWAQASPASVRLASNVTARMIMAELLDCAAWIRGRNPHTRELQRAPVRCE